MTALTTYQRQRAALAAQASPVRAAAKDILDQLQTIERCLYWALDPSEVDGGQQWATSVIEHAHALVDMAHDYRAALAVNPPPKEDEENSEDNPSDPLQFTR